MEFLTAPAPVGYPEAVTFMEDRVAKMRAGEEGELVWLVEHPPLYTAGTSADRADLLTDELPVYESGRGGQFTYHGPGQRVIYVMLDLKKRQQSPDLKRYICQLEEWVITVLARLGVTGERRPGRVGIWVQTPGGEKKIAAIGVRIRHWISYHGIAINLNPDLMHFRGIVPCGISEHGVTSLADLGVPCSMARLDALLKAEFEAVFGGSEDPACRI